MANSYTYDAATVSIQIDGQFMEDYGEGDFLQWEKSEDNLDVKVSANGTVGAAVRNNNLGSVTYKPMQGSPEVNFLHNLANTKKVFPIAINSGGDNPEIITGSRCMILKNADGSLSDEMGDREFEVTVFDYTIK